MVFLTLAAAIYVWSVNAYELALEDVGAPQLPPWSTWVRVGMWLFPRLAITFAILVMIEIARVVPEMVP